MFFTKNHFLEARKPPARRMAVSQTVEKEVSFRASAHAGVGIPRFLNFFNQKSTFFSYYGDCHTSDIGHWFAMTVFLTHSNTASPKAGGIC